MSKIGRNDPCPCGSGKKYKNCCLLKDSTESLSENRVFSFNNYQLLYGYSPFNLPVDLDVLKDADGSPAEEIGETFMNGKMYHVRTADGFSQFPYFCTRPENGHDTGLMDLVSSEEVFLDYQKNRRADLMQWIYEFHTLAFLADDMHPAFALVSTDSEELGKFNLRSEIYPVRGDLYPDIIRFFGEKGNPFPLGELTMEISCDIYIVPCWMMEAFIVEHEKLDIEYKFISEEELDMYVHSANDKTQYGPGTRDFLTLGRKYRKHCTYLMELLCTEEDMQVNVKMQQYKAWTEKLLKLQESHRDIDLDNDANWIEYQKEMDGIIDIMISESLSRSAVRESVRERLSKEHAGLEPDALEFLIQAETLYELNKQDYIDFTPIVVEYAKVLERQLEYVLEKAGIKAEHPSLGAFIKFITNDRIVPYYERYKQFYQIKNIRNTGAHTGRCTLNDVEKIRKFYYDAQLLELISGKS